MPRHAAACGLENPMRLPLLAAALSMTLGAVAAPIDTLARMRETGVATMGVREASGALSYRVGENAFAGFHVELCQRVLGDARQKLGLHARGDLELAFELRPTVQAR